MSEHSDGFLLCYFRLSRTPGAIGMMLNKAVGCFSKTKCQNTRKRNNCGKINLLFDDLAYPAYGGTFSAFLLFPSPLRHSEKFNRTRKIFTRVEISKKA